MNLKLTDSSRLFIFVTLYIYLFFIYLSVCTCLYHWIWQTRNTLFFFKLFLLFLYKKEITALSLVKMIYLSSYSVYLSKCSLRQILLKKTDKNCLKFISNMNFEQILVEFPPCLWRIIPNLEKLIIKINQHKMSAIFNSIFHKEHFLPKYTNIYI